MRLSAVLLCVACWPQLDAFLLLNGVNPGRYVSRSRSRSTDVLGAESDDPEEVKVTVRIKKPAPKDDDGKVTVRIKEPAPKDDGPPASPTTLAIESTFVQAASGMNGANYEFGLMEFIRAARDAFDEGIMVPALNLELSMCTQYTAGRPLQSDEIDLRTVWLSLAYLTFERVGYQSKSADTFPGQSVAADLRAKFYTFTVSRTLCLALTHAHHVPRSRDRSVAPPLTTASMTSSTRRSKAMTWTA